MAKVNNTDVKIACRFVDRLAEKGYRWMCAYPYPHVVIVYEKNEVEHLREMFPELKPMRGRGMATEYSLDGYKVILVGFIKTAGVNTIAHECVHVKNYIYGSVGVKTDPDNDEAEAYFFGYLFSAVYEFAMQAGIEP